MENISVWKLNLKSENAIAIIPSEKWNTLNEATEALPGGAYTTFRTFSLNRCLHLMEHFTRLEETSHLAGHSIALEREGILHALRKMIQNSQQDQRIRLIIDLEREIGTIYLLSEPLPEVPTPKYTCGVQAITVAKHRGNPKAKLTGFIHQAELIRDSLPDTIEEALMFNEDAILLEGLSSNFYGVLNGTIWTAEEGVLSGITRRLVLEEARTQNIPVHLGGVPVSMLGDLSEAFITSVSRGVMPVTKIDSVTIGTGMPGPITRVLMAAYTNRLEKDTELI